MHGQPSPNLRIVTRCHTFGSVAGSCHVKPAAVVREPRRAVAVDCCRGAVIGARCTPVARTPLGADVGIGNGTAGMPCQTSGLSRMIRLL